MSEDTALNQVLTCLSSSLEIIGRTETGRKPVFGSEAGPDLWTGVTRASLRAERQVSDWMLQVRTLVRLSRIAGEMSFSNGALIPSRPVATFVGSDLINLSKELTSRSGISKFAVDGFLSFRKLTMCDRSGVAGWLLSTIDDAIETKCLIPRSLQVVWHWF